MSKKQIDIGISIEDAAWTATENAIEFSTEDAIEFVITNVPYWDIGNALDRELKHVK
jgi:hypothetical protein